MSDRPRSRRRSVLAGLGSVAALGSVAGCTGFDLAGDDSDGDDHHHDGDHGDDDHHDGGHDEEHHHDGHDASDVPDLEPLVDALAEEAPPADGEVAVGVGFLEEELPLTTAVYEPASGTDVRDTERYDRRALEDVSLLAQPPERLPVVSTESLDLYRFGVEPGATRRLALVVESEESVSFESHPPATAPFEYGSGVAFTCYCTDEVYEVPGEGRWARIVELDLGSGVEPGTTGVVAYPVDVVQ